MRTSALDGVSPVLVIVGRLNRGLFGIGPLVTANWNLTDLLIGSFPTIEVLVSVSVGLAGEYEPSQLYSARNGPPTCDRESAQ